MYTDYIFFIQPVKLNEDVIFSFTLKIIHVHGTIFHSTSGLLTVLVISSGKYSSFTINHFSKIERI